MSQVYKLGPFDARLRHIDGLSGFELASEAALADEGLPGRMRSFYSSFNCSAFEV